ncbi:glycosyltransferase [Pseudodesulfovibrio sp.]|uniref:glycosyltransferase n=1 Tax=unclassified Pseudodesulfovibrio TaxID=2661612 RepID=UPI003B001048
MKVLFLIASLEIGGAERQLVACANGLAARKHDVQVLTLYPGGPLETKLTDVSLRTLNKRGRWDLVGCAGRLIRAIRDFNPDAIYSFLGTSNILAGALKGLAFRAPMVWSIRASNMDLAHYDYAARLAARIEVMLSRRATAIIANSHAGKAHAIARGMNADKIEVIPNGIDTDIFVPDRERGAALRQKWTSRNTDILIGVIARFDPMKGHVTLLAAANRIKEHNAAIRFVCVGSGRLERTIQDKARELGLADSFAWPGALQDMVAVYNALDICCLPSSFGEGFPNALGEAMSCNIPCLATDVGDAAMVIGETGIVVPPDAPEALADGLLRLAAGIARNETPDAREHILAHYSLEAMVDATETALSALCRRAG